jgi:hypothetical protein
MSQLHLNWVRAAILAANDGVVSDGALGRLREHPAVGEYMSVATLTDAEEAASLAVSANP